MLVAKTFSAVAMIGLDNLTIFSLTHVFVSPMIVLVVHRLIHCLDVQFNGPHDGQILPAAFSLLACLLSLARAVSKPSFLTGNHVPWI